MPTILHAPLSKSALAKLTEVSQNLAAPVRGDWGGYVPDINPKFLSLSDAKECSGVVSKGGILKQDDGFAKVDSASLPLGAASSGVVTDISIDNPTEVTDVAHGLIGGDTVTVASSNSTPVIDGSRVIYRLTADKFTVPVNVTGQGTSATWTLAANPAVVGLFQYRNNAQTLHRLAMTTGRLYLLSSGTWTPQPLDTSTTTAISTSKEKLADGAFYQLADKFYFCNDDDIVWYYDGSKYGRIEANENFKARSVEAFADRLNFFNVTDTGGTARPYRLQFTNINAAPDLTSAGSGYIDFTEMESEGLRVETLGDMLACYFRNGVVLLQRTLLSSVPYNQNIVSTQRGLLSTHSLVNIGSGLHFGIFTDGWFFLDSNGRWTEAGVKNLGGRLERKWNETFYTSLDWSNRDRVCLTYDPINHFIRIAFPSAGGSGDPDEVWTYSIKNDAVWKNDYATYGDVNCWGEFEDESGGYTYATISTHPDGDAYDDLEHIRYVDLAAHTGQRHVVHGTIEGYVYRHDPLLITKDGDTPSWEWQSYELDLGSPTIPKTADKIWVEYERQSAAPQLEVKVNGQGEQQSANLTLDQGSLNEYQEDYVGFRLTASRLGIELGGSAPVELHGLQLNYRQGRGERVR